LLKRVPPGRLLFAPETGWAYSNIGYLLLRQAVERVTGSSLAEALARLVLLPLGMQVARVAETADDMQRTAFPPRHVYDPGWVYHGCVVGPVAEAALALHRLLAGELLGDVSRQAMLRRFALGGSLPGRPWLSTGYGLGVMMGSMQDPGGGPAIEVIGHSAGGPGSTGAVYSAAGPAGRRCRPRRRPRQHRRGLQRRRPGRTAHGRRFRRSGGGGRRRICDPEDASGRRFAARRIAVSIHCDFTSP